MALQARICVGVIAILLGCEGQMSRPADERIVQGAAFVLEETKAWSVPIGRPYTDGVILSDSTVVVRTPIGEVDLFNSDHDPSVIHSGVRIVARQIRSSGEATAILVSSEGDVFEATATGNVVGPLYRCEALARSFDLSVTRSGWISIVAIEEDPSNLELLWFQGEGGDCEVAIRAGVPSDYSMIIPVDDSEFLIASPDPLRTVLRARVDQGWIRVSEASGFEADAWLPEAERARASGPPASWVGLRLLVLDSGYFRTVADLRSRSRVLVLWSSAGAHAMSSRIDGPLGFAAAAPDRRLLLAMRGDGAGEVVLYRWSWSGMEQGR